MTEPTDNWNEVKARLQTRILHTGDHDEMDLEIRLSDIAAALKRVEKLEKDYAGCDLRNEQLHDALRSALHDRDQLREQVVHWRESRQRAVDAGNILKDENDQLREQVRKWKDAFTVEVKEERELREQVRVLREFALHVGRTAQYWHDHHCQPVFKPYKRCAPQCPWQEYGVGAEEALARADAVKGGAE